MDREFLTVIGALSAFFWVMGEWLCAIFRAGRDDHAPGRLTTALLSSVPLWAFLILGFIDVPGRQRLLIAVVAPGVLYVLHIGTLLTKRIREFGFDRFTMDIPLFDPMRRPVWSAALLVSFAALICAAIVHLVR